LQHAGLLCGVFVRHFVLVWFGSPFEGAEASLHMAGQRWQAAVLVSCGFTGPSSCLGSAACIPCLHANCQSGPEAHVAMSGAVQWRVDIQSMKDTCFKQVAFLVHCERRAERLAESVCRFAACRAALWLVCTPLHVGFSTLNARKSSFSCAGSAGQPRCLQLVVTWKRFPASVGAACSQCVPRLFLHASVESVLVGAPQLRNL
jgi:hypothetical protein